MTHRSALPLASTLAALGLLALFTPSASAAEFQTLKVSKLGTGTGTVVSAPAGIECGATCQAHEFEPNGSLTLIAKPSQRSSVAQWIGCNEVPAEPNECKLTLNGPHTDVSVEFSAIPQQTLTVANPGSGLGAGTVTAPPPGSEFTEIDCGNGPESCSAQYNQGATVTLTAVPDERSTFTGWTGCTAVHGDECEVDLTAATEVKAEFAPRTQETLTVANPGSGLGAGTVTAPPPGSEFTEIDCGNGPESCSAQYNQGATLTLTAVPDERSTFTAWTGCTAVHGTECEVEMTAAKSVEAKFAALTQEALAVTTQGTGAGSVTGTSPGSEFTEIDCGNGAETCESHYNEGATLILFASPATHSKFTGWTGCPNVLSSNQYETSECEVQLAAATEVRATFEPIPQAQLAVEIEGSGELTSSPSGISCTEADAGTCAESFDTEGPASTVTLFAAAGPDNHLQKWEGCQEEPSETECRVTLSTAKSVKAVFLPTLHTLTVAPTGTGSVTAATGTISACKEAAGACSGEYAEGATITLTAAPAAHEHVTWTGCTVSKSNPDECEVKIGESPAAVKAAFSVNLHPLTVLRTGPGLISATSGLISRCGGSGGLCTAEYAETSTVTLTAQPAAHYHLEAWHGCTAISPAGDCEVQIGTAAATVTAEFAPNLRSLTVSPSGSGSIDASSGPIASCSSAGGQCVGEYTEGTTLTLTASPAPHQAVAWAGCAQSSATSCEVRVGSSATEVEATFAQITHTLTTKLAGSGQGSLTCNGAPCASTYPDATVLTLAATPAPGSTFAGWSGAGCSGTGACHLTLEVDTSLTATFNASPPPPAEEKCVVPQLAGKSLAQARSALSAARCSLGKVTKPKKKKGHTLGPLLVKSTSPSAGSTLPAGSKVNLTLGPKPKKGKK